MGRRVEETSTRAERFHVEMPVRYRLPDSREWYEALTENVSRTGVLIRGECEFPPATLVDVLLEVPQLSRDDGPAEVVCQGEVVRKEGPRRSNLFPAVAVAIHNFRLRRKSLSN